MSGHDVVLYKSLENSLRSSEYQLLPHIIKCVLLLISKMQLKHLNMKNSLEVINHYFLKRIYTFLLYIYIIYLFISGQSLMMS